MIKPFMALTGYIDPSHRSKKTSAATIAAEVFFSSKQVSSQRNSLRQLR